jgi:hypothetical protein
MKPLFFASAMILTTGLSAATLKLSGTLPEGVKVTSISAYYSPTNPVYGCMSGESEEGKVSTSQGSFKAQLRYGAQIGGFLCKRKLSSISLTFKIGRKEGNIVQSQGDFSSHTLSFGIKGDKPVSLQGLDLTCKQEGERVSEGSYDVVFARGLSKCETTSVVNLPTHGSSEVKGISFNIVDIESRRNDTELTVYVNCC